MAATKRIVNVAVRPELVAWLDYAGKAKATTATGYINALIYQDMSATLEAARVARGFVGDEGESGESGESSATVSAGNGRPRKAAARRLAQDAAALAVASGMTPEEWRALMDETEAAARDKAECSKV